MPVDSQSIRSERFLEIGTLIQRDASQVIQLWSQRAIAEQPNALRVHHTTLLNALAQFLQGLGKSPLRTNLLPPEKSGVASAMNVNDGAPTTANAAA